MKLSKIPKHIWLGVLLPFLLVGLGTWRLWPEFDEYRGSDEAMTTHWLIHLVEVQKKQA